MTSKPAPKKKTPAARKPAAPKSIMTEAKGICFTNFRYKDRYNVSVTVRDGGREEAEASLLALLDIINDVIEPTLVQTHEIDFDGVDFDDTGEPQRTPAKPAQQPPKNPAQYDVEVVEKLMKAGDWQPHDEQWIQVDEFKRDDKCVEFFKANDQHKVHTHYTNTTIGFDKMNQQFTDNWQKYFPETAGKRFPIKGGSIIIKIVGSETRRTSGNAAGNVFRNFEEMRR